MSTTIQFSKLVECGVTRTALRLMAEFVREHTSPDSELFRRMSECDIERAQSLELLDLETMSLAACVELHETLLELEREAESRLQWVQEPLAEMIRRDWSEVRGCVDLRIGELRGDFERRSP